VRFDLDAGPFHVGDHWLVPARTARLVYGVSALAGTIEWPADDAGQPLPRPPAGVVHHVAAIALLDRAAGAGEAGGWTLVADCRRLFPSLTDLITLDLLGGDGQVAPTGEPLPERVRVVVRAGGLAVPGARVCFTAAGGHLSPADAVPDGNSPGELPVTTDDSGYAEVRWLLGRDGPDTQVLTAALVDPADRPTGAEVRVTGRRQRPTGGAACIVVAAGSDLVRLFDDHAGARSLLICLEAGDWALDEPAVLRRVGTVRVEGAGAATRLTSTGESALRFEDCFDVHVRDLAVESRPVAGAEGTAGALAVLRAERVHVERVAARVTGAPVPRSAGIRVGGHGPAGTDPSDRVLARRVVVRDCRVEVGDLQTGVLVADALRCDVIGTEVRAWRPADADAPALQEWLEEAEFALLVARRAIAGALSEAPGLGPRTGFAERVEGVLDQPFGTEIVDSQGRPDRAGWRDYATVVGSTDLSAVLARVRADLMTADRASRFYREGTLFARWRQGVEEDLVAGPAAGRGVVVTGVVGTDVRVLDCSVTGALQGIITRGLIRGTMPRVQLRGNTIIPPPRSAVAFAEQAMDVGSCEVLTVSVNEVRAVEQQRFPVDGLRCAERLGVHAVADRNTFVGIAVGIRVGTDAAPPTTLRVARDNVSTAGPVLVDGSGIWRSEGNVE
jgi:CBS domain-containing protein